MANYATVAHFKTRLGEEVIDDLTQPTMPMTTEEYLDFLLENSCGLIDGYIAKYYNTPYVSDASDAFLREITLDLSEYEIWKRAVGDDVPTKYKTSYDMAMQVLRDISEGKLAPLVSESRNSSIDIATDQKVMSEAEISFY